MKYLAALIFALLFFSCGPCNCDDCCVGSLYYGFKNATDQDIEVFWYSRIANDTFTALADEEVALQFFAAPTIGGAISQPPFAAASSSQAFTYDSVIIRVNDAVIERFDQADCTRNPLCESAYLDESERGDNRGDQVVFRYIYE